MSELTELERARDAVVDAAIKQRLLQKDLADVTVGPYVPRSGIIYQAWLESEYEERSAVDRLLAARAAQGRTA